jgi:ferredoxin
MNVWIIAGEVAFLLVILFFSWFSFVNILEKEKKAFVRSTLFLLFFLSLNILFFLIDDSSKTYLFAATAMFFSCAVFWLLVGPSPKQCIQIPGDQKKIDERDVIFARFDLQEGTQAFDEYYSHHPEFQSVDGMIRKLPDLFDPSHNKKDPKLFALAEAEFDFLEHQLTEVDGKTGSESVISSEEENASLIKRILRYLGSEVSGIALLDQSYVYSHTGRGPDIHGEKIVLDHRFAIVFAVEMDLAMVAAAPKAPVVVETGKKYVEAARIAIILASFIRHLGYPARAHIAGSNYQAMLPPLGWQAGLGEVGRIGTLITTKFGPRARLGLVTTSLPLKPDKPRTIGIQDFCEKCRKCAAHCPAQAIPFGKKKEENGVLKWVLNREECYRYWRKAGTDCAVCMYVCPYSKPVNLFHDFIRRLASKSSVAQSLSVWGDDFFYGRKPSRKKPIFK